ncbi:cation-transporting P-type ATPase 13A2, partial [Pancytospora philotis]
MSSQPHHSISIIGKRHVSNFTFVLRSVLSLGVVYVLCQLCCGAAIFLKTSNCELWEADCVVVEDEYKNRGLYRVRRVRVSPTLGLARYTRNGHVSIADTPYGRFIYDYKAGRFVSPVYQPALGQNLSDAVQSALQRSEKEEATALYESRIIFGENSLGVKLPTNAEIIKRRVFEKIFLWELFSIVVWILINYTRYVAVVGNIYLYVFIKKIVRDIGYRNEQRTSSRVGTVRVVRNGAFADVLATDVYPGDIIGINLTDKFECDAVILEGDAISDESYLTGEAVPICKGPRAVVYAGTRVIKSRGAAIVKESGQAQGLVRVKNLLRKQTDSSLGGGAAEKQSQTDVAIGLVIKTGKKTKSGLMLTSVLVRKPASNVFSEQSNRIIMQLLAATCAIMVLLFAYLSYTIPVMRAVRYALDLAIAFFSPALFSAWEIGIEYSCNELKKQGINTTDIRRINTAGEVDMVVFDKTGTLTEIGVDILCFDTIDRALERFGDLDPTAQLGFSTCHNVMELDGDYSGDILDMKMFQFSGAALCVGDKQRTVFSADDD